MEKIFYIENGLQDVIHGMIKKHNLRYVKNSMESFGKWDFHISGDVHDMNNFDQEMYEMLDRIEKSKCKDVNCIAKNKTFLKRILSWSFF